MSVQDVYPGMHHTFFESTTHVVSSVRLCLWSAWQVPSFKVVFGSLLPLGRAVLMVDMSL